MAGRGIGAGAWRGPSLALLAGAAMVVASMLLPWADRFPRGWQLPLARTLSAWNKVLTAEIGTAIAELRVRLAALRQPPAFRSNRSSR